MPGKTTGFLFAVLFGLAAGSVSAAERPLPELFREAVAASGEEYLDARNAIVGRGQAAVGFLEERRETAASREERLLAEILLERIAFEPEIASAVAKDIEYEWDRSVHDRIKNCGKALAARFGRFPLVLAELLWKGNELEGLRRKRAGGGYYFPLRDPSEGGKANAAHALGILKEKKALPVLLGILDQGDADKYHELIEAEGRFDELVATWEAARAIGAMGMPETVPELLRIMKDGSGPASSAFECWADRKALLPLLEEAVAKEEDADFKFRRLERTNRSPADIARAGERIPGTVAHRWTGALAPGAPRDRRGRPGPGRRRRVSRFPPPAPEGLAVTANIRKLAGCSGTPGK